MSVAQQCIAHTPRGCLHYCLRGLPWDPRSTQLIAPQSNSLLLLLGLFFDQSTSGAQATHNLHDHVDFRMYAKPASKYLYDVTETEFPPQKHVNYRAADDALAQKSRYSASLCIGEKRDPDFP